MFISSVEYCPVCHQFTEMIRQPMKLAIYEVVEHPANAPLPLGGWKTKRIGTVKAWITCGTCATVVRSEEDYT